MATNWTQPAGSDLLGRENATASFFLAPSKITGFSRFTVTSARQGGPFKNGRRRRSRRLRKAAVGGDDDLAKRRAVGNSEDGLRRWRSWSKRLPPPGMTGR